MTTYRRSFGVALIVLALALFAQAPASEAARKQSLCVPAPGTGHALVVLASSSKLSSLKLRVSGLPAGSRVGRGSASAGRRGGVRSLAVGGSTAISELGCISVSISGRVTKTLGLIQTCASIKSNGTLTPPTRAGGRSLARAFRRAWVSNWRGTIGDWVDQGCPND